MHFGWLSKKYKDLKYLVILRRFTCAVYGKILDFAVRYMAVSYMVTTVRYMVNCAVYGQLLCDIW